MKLFYKTEVINLCFCCKLNCDWCAEKDVAWRTIRKNQFSRSLVSNPWFRDGHCIVIPVRHISSVRELTAEESADIMAELGRLGGLLDAGFGTGVMQKYAPRQTQNGIKMNHLHFHVFPRREKEDGIFPTPYPNAFSAFYQPDESVVIKLVERLRQ